MALGYWWWLYWLRHWWLYWAWPPRTKVKDPIINVNIDMRRNLVNMYSHWTLAFFVQPRDRPWMDAELRIRAQLFFWQLFISTWDPLWKIQKSLSSNWGVNCWPDLSRSWTWQEWWARTQGRRQSRRCPWPTSRVETKRGLSLCQSCYSPVSVAGWVAVLAINDESLSSLSEEPQVLVRLSKMIFKTTKTKIVSPCVLESHYWANRNVTQIQRVIDQV